MRFVVTFLAFLLLSAAYLAGWLLWVVPPSSPIVWGMPVVVFFCGTMVVWRMTGLRYIVPVNVLAACLAWIVVNMVWPNHSSSVPPVSSVEPAVVTGELIRIPVKVPESFTRTPFLEPRTLWGPKGLNVQVFAAGIGPARFMCLHPSGALLVSVPKEGEVLALPDLDHDGVADRVVIFADGLDRPHGLARRGDEILVAEHSRLLSLVDRDGDLQADERSLLSSDLPGGRGHWTRNVAIGAGGTLFVSAGSSCNSCVEEDVRRAAILKFHPKGGFAELYARGLRNSVGLAIHPETNDLWASDNGRDMLGDDLPPEEINLIVAGGDYGWPYCYGDRVPDPELGSIDRCSSTLAPKVAMQAHSAPLGITFGRGLDFPAAYQEMLFVAFHGSWNRREPTGYKLVGIPFTQGMPTGVPEDVISGWLVGREAWGRPVAPLVGADGALYLSDDRAGAVYRITWPDKADHSSGG